MAYPYYQQVPPGQPGTAQLMLVDHGPIHSLDSDEGRSTDYIRTPTAPAFQPQSTWGGLDYYRAHAPKLDSALFQHAWDRVRQFDMSTASGLGVGIHEARHWHRRAYGGMNELSVMTPTEIGHAAAYEAYRTWMHNRSMYEPLGPDIERQREGLIGLAVAESSRLLSFAGRSMDYYARQTASDAAAHTASFIFYQSDAANESLRDGQDDEYSYHRGRPGSRYGDYDYEDEDPYVHDRFDDSYSDGYRDYGRRGRSHSRSPCTVPFATQVILRWFTTEHRTQHQGCPLTPGMPPPMHPPTPGGMPIHPGGTPYPGQPMSFSGSSYAGSAVGGMGGQPYYGAPGVSV
ncbi:hypothetical protein FA13DRAFT_1752283 [Coprinellus micaceus]|uniref:Uncharacterized protein n=1 Tax=Coprinellus micaceus TaxID=71717 RepID=A0A4Y7TTM6_COPMI|nr:hypothetical protein FA13DRAFT_1752283 [Coprinellus micaceus]